MKRKKETETTKTSTRAEEEEVARVLRGGMMDAKAC
jgi:hypothetical protein